MCLPHDDRAIFNVAIRTIQVKDDQAIYGVGGGGLLGIVNGKVSTEKHCFLYKSQPPFDILTAAKMTQKR